MIMAGHEVLKFVCYCISKEPDANGKFQINWVAERHMQPTLTKWRREDYNRNRKARRIFAVVQGLEVRLARRTRPDPQLPRTPMNIRWSNRDPIPRWTLARSR